MSVDTIADKIASGILTGLEVLKNHPSADYSDRPGGTIQRIAEFDEILDGKY